MNIILLLHKSLSFYKTIYCGIHVHSEVWACCRVGSIIWVVSILNDCICIVCCCCILLSMDLMTVSRWNIIDLSLSMYCMHNEWTQMDIKISVHMQIAESCKCLNIKFCITDTFCEQCYDLLYNFKKKLFSLSSSNYAQSERNPNFRCESEEYHACSQKTITAPFIYIKITLYFEYLSIICIFNPFASGIPKVLLSSITGLFSVKIR